jgi:hypothetical protein
MEIPMTFLTTVGESTLKEAFGVKTITK